MPCTTNGSPCSGKEQAMPDSPADIFFIVVLQKKQSLCKHTHHCSAPSFPPSSTSQITSTSPNHKPGATGSAGERQVTELIPETAAGRQQQVSSSGRKNEIHTRGYVCSLFSALELPLTNVRTSGRQGGITVHSI